MSWGVASFGKQILVCAFPRMALAQPWENDTTVAADFSPKGAVIVEPTRTRIVGDKNRVAESMGVFFGPKKFKLSQRNGAPERIRTSDPQIRSLVLYPAELRARATNAR
jgi:hypothetical protein